MPGIHLSPAERQDLLDHYLPNYAPDTHPIERVWWRLHEAGTRNHRCHTMQELLDRTFDWFDTRTHFGVQSEVFKDGLGK